jgi:hypothetical protein
MWTSLRTNLWNEKASKLLERNPRE